MLAMRVVNILTTVRRLGIKIKNNLFQKRLNFFFFLLRQKFWCPLNKNEVFYI